MAARSLHKGFFNVTVSFVVTRLLIVAIGFIGYATFPKRGQVYQIRGPKANTNFKATWHTFDSGWYVKLAKEGYPQRPFTDDVEETWGFMPLYPLSMHLAAKLFGGDLFYIGIIINNICAVLALLLVYRLAQQKFKTGVETAHFILICAGSFYLSIVYAEGLFLLLTAGTFYYSFKNKYVLAFVFAGLASVTRIQGCLLFAVPAVDILCSNYRTSYKHVPGALLGLLPMAAFMLYLHQTCGEPLAFIKIQNAWGSTQTYPLQGIINLFVGESPGSSYMNSLFWVMILGAVALQYRKLPLSYTIFTLLYFMLSTGNEIVYGTTRYMLGVLPLFIAISLSNNHVKQFFTVVNLLLLGLTISAFVTDSTTFL